MNNVIIALATPPLKGALALIRVSGDGAFEITDQIFSKRVSGTEKREIYYGTPSLAKTSSRFPATDRC